MRFKGTLLVATAAAYFFCATNASAGTYPQTISAQFDWGWDNATWAAGEIYSTQKDSTWIEYRTDRISQSHVNAVFARVGKWGGGSGTDPYAYQDNWYFEELDTDTLHESCPSSELAIYGKTGDLVCGAVDWSNETWLSTCYDQNGNAQSCRIYQFSEYDAYDDTCIITDYNGGSGFHSSRFGLMKYRYPGGSTNYYRTFMIYNSVS